MEALKVVDLEPNTTYTVTQWTLKQSKYGDRLLIKAKKEDESVLVWSNALLFNELISISDNKVNFARLLGVTYTFKIIGFSTYNNYKTALLDTDLS